MEDIRGQGQLSSIVQELLVYHPQMALYTSWLATSVSSVNIIARIRCHRGIHFSRPRHGPHGHCTRRHLVRRHMRRWHPFRRHRLRTHIGRKALLGWWSWCSSALVFRVDPMTCCSVWSKRPCKWLAQGLSFVISLLWGKQYLIHTHCP